MSKFSLKHFIQCALVVAVLVLLVVYIKVPLNFLSLVFHAAVPLLLGCVLAYILNLLRVRFEKVWLPKSRNRFVIRTRRSVCILLSIHTLVVILLAAFFADACVTARSILRLNQRLEHMEEIAEKMREISDHIGEEI